MVLFVDLLQAFPGYMRIDLGGGNISMAEHELHGAEVRSVFQKMRGKTMAKHMGGQRL